MSEICTVWNFYYDDEEKIVYIEGGCTEAISLDKSMGELIRIAIEHFTIASQFNGVPFINEEVLEVEEDIEEFTEIGGTCVLISFAIKFPSIRDRDIYLDIATDE